MGGHESSPGMQKFMDEKAAEHFGLPIHDEGAEFTQTRELRELQDSE
jgi:hypothetical protein